MAHVVASDDVGAVGQAARVLVVGRSQQQGRRVDGPAGDYNDIGGKLHLLPMPFDNDLTYFTAGRRCFESLDERVREQRYVRVLCGRIDRTHLTICFGIDQACEAVAGAATNAAASQRVRFIEHNT